MTKRKTTIDPQVEWETKCNIVYEWNGFVKGDLVHVKGTKNCEYRFQYARERDGVVMEVTVVGGEPANRRSSAHTMFRTFLPERVQAPSQAKRRRSRREATKPEAQEAR